MSLISSDVNSRYEIREVKTDEHRRIFRGNSIRNSATVCNVSDTLQDVEVSEYPARIVGMLQ